VPARKSAPHKRLTPEHGWALAKALRDVRESAGLTQEDVAASSGVSVQLVRRIEAGTSNPTLGTLTAIAGVLRTSVAEIAQRAGL
jgi:transcriptional regulator with XRE-family HTH domain